jgi:hypothetical protein
MPKHDGSSDRGYRFQAPPLHTVLQAPDGAPRLTSDEGPGLVAAKPQNAGHGKDCLHWPLTGLPGSSLGCGGKGHQQPTVIGCPPSLA